MSTSYIRRRGDLVTCEAMAEPHEVHIECCAPVLVHRPQPSAPFARRVQSAKAQGRRISEARP